MQPTNERFQHVESEVKDVQKRVRRLESAPAPSTENNGEQKPKREYRFDKMNVALMTVFTGALVITSYLQWQAARAAIADTHKSFEIGTRAWVVMKSADIKPTKPDAPIVQENGIPSQHSIVQEGRGLKDSHGPAISVALVNAGHSPAMKLLKFSQIGVLNELPTNAYVNPAGDSAMGESSGLVVAPDGTFGADQGMLLTDDQLANIKSGRQFLAVWGRLTYEDIFNGKRETKFCVYYDRVTEFMVACPQYNSAN